MSESFISCVHSSSVRYPLLVPSEQLGHPLDVSLGVAWWHEEKELDAKVRLFVQKHHVNIENKNRSIDVLKKFKNWSLLIAKGKTLYGDFQLSDIQDEDFDILMFDGDLKN